MGEATGIEWTDSTWNPFIGCRRVSAGCAHCYAERVVNGRMRGEFGAIRRAVDTTFYVPLRWHRPRRVFACSISDFFIEEADPWRADAWDVVRRTPHLTYQILTKRPQRILSCLPPDWGIGYPNVWLGTSIESSREIHRWDTLLDVPAFVHFVSAEPLLGPLLNGHSPTLQIGRRLPNGGWIESRMDWVIVGGESGPGARPMEPDWARQVRDFCLWHKIAFFFKQVGGTGDKQSHEKALLDGRTWKEIPG